MTCTDSPGTVAWDALVQLAIATRTATPKWHEAGIKAALRDACGSERKFTFADLARAVVFAAMNPECLTPASIGFDSVWSHVGPPAAKKFGWEEGDPRYVCGICDLSEPACRARSATNGHDFTPRTECMPAQMITPIERPKQCLGGHREHPCPLPPGHAGDHHPPPRVELPPPMRETETEPATEGANG